MLLPNMPHINILGNQELMIYYCIFRSLLAHIIFEYSVPYIDLEVWITLMDQRSQN